MEPPVCLIESALSELLVEIQETGQLTLADRYGLLAAVFDDNLTEEELRSLCRIYRAITKKQVQVVDQISTVHE